MHRSALEVHKSAGANEVGVRKSALLEMRKSALMQVRGSALMEVRRSAQVRKSAGANI